MMDIERLKELKSWVNDLRKFGVSEGNEIIVLIDEAIARQSETEKVVCPDCNGSGEIARQSVTSEEDVKDHKLASLAITDLQLKYLP